MLGDFFLFFLCVYAFEFLFLLCSEVLKKKTLEYQILKYKLWHTRYQMLLFLGAVVCFGNRQSHSQGQF